MNPKEAQFQLLAFLHLVIAGALGSSHAHTHAGQAPSVNDALCQSVSRTRWCNHGIRKLDIPLDAHLSKRQKRHYGYTTSVPVYFKDDDDLDSVARDFLQTYLIDDLEATTLVRAMRQELSKEEPVTWRCAEPELFFVEIGTSDFGTLHQQLYADPRWEGVAVEPLPELLHALPSRPGLFKENAAFGCGAAGAEGSKDMVRAPART